MATLVSVYEERSFPIGGSCTPTEYLHFMMEQNGLTPEDLVRASGRLNRTHEVLNGKRDLTLAMMHRLYRHAVLLIGVCSLKAARG